MAGDFGFDARGGGAFLGGRLGLRRGGGDLLLRSRRVREGRGRLVRSRTYKFIVNRCVMSLPERGFSQDSVAE